MSQDSLPQSATSPTSGDNPSSANHNTEQPAGSARKERGQTHFADRSYLSAVEAARVLGMSVADVHRLARTGALPYQRATSGQMRFQLGDLHKLLQATRGPGDARDEHPAAAPAGHGESVGTVPHNRPPGGNALHRQGKHRHAQHPAPADMQVAGVSSITDVHICSTTQTVVLANAQQMHTLEDGSVNLVVTSPPYFDAKLYSQEAGDLGNIHDLDAWLDAIGQVWAETYRVLQPGRKAFINIMNLPARVKGTFRSLNLVGKTIDLCEGLGFIFKREIIWHKTNSVRAHFGSFPYPGGILLNYAHEFILEFEKPAPRGYRKYAHLTPEQKEMSKLAKDFWISLKKSDVWTMTPERSGAGRKHAAPFPVELPLRLIRAYSYVGETVLDPFLGSGTTLVAAALTGRHGVGYDISPEYVQMAVRRLSAVDCQADLAKHPKNE